MDATTEMNKTPKRGNPNQLPFPDGYTIEANPIGRNIQYTFRDSEGRETWKNHNTEPLQITEQSNVGREIKKHLDPDNQLNKKTISTKFEDIRLALHELHQLQLIEAEAEQDMEDKRAEELRTRNMEAAKALLHGKDHLLLYISSLVAWHTAGERSNIILTWIAYCSQIILQNPISVIGLGEGASGKTHIQEVAMQMIPRDFVLHEKSITEAAMFNRAKEDPYYYDGCIVNYGDMGGRNSQDFILEAKNLLKELQSDGFLNKPLNIPSEDGWSVVDITLYGRPALTYTTVPGFEFDDQEMSRSIFITPRMDNRDVFNARKQILELHHGRTYKQYQQYKHEIEVIPYLVEVIRDHVRDLTIINPYTSSIIDFLGESEYFKRDFDKYNGILKTITALNSYNRPTFDLDGETVIFTNIDDIQLFTSLLESYHESISVNISPKSAEILDDLRAHMDDWLLGGETMELGITVNQYFELTRCNLSKRSVRRYFGELNNAGFLKVVGQNNRANIYALSGRVSGNLLDDLLKMSEEQRELISWELGDVALQFIEEDAPHEGLHILLPDLDVDVPGWERYDHVKPTRRKVK